MRGDYVELLPQYGPLGFNWYDFPHTEWTIGDNVACVQCGEPIRTGYVYDLFVRSEEASSQVEKNEEAVVEIEAGDGQAQAEVDSSAPDAVSDTGIDADAGLYDAVS